MSAIDLAHITLNNTKTFLNESKAEIYAMLNDPNVVEWRHISFEKNAAFLKMLGISTQDLTKALTEYPKSAKEISRKIALWNNEVGNQLADLVGIERARAEMEERRLAGIVDPKRADFRAGQEQ